jgi:hypothetical protein
VKETRTKITAPGLDADGLLLSAIGFGALVFAMIEGRTIGWWTPTAELNIFGWCGRSPHRSHQSRSSPRSVSPRSHCS